MFAIENAGPPDGVTVREWVAQDYSRAYSLWDRCELTLGVSDSEVEIDRHVKRNPTLALVAASGDELVGTVLGGYDGRRGIIHHLAVDPDWRNRGIARALMRTLEERMKRLGVVKINFWIEARNGGAVAFYKRIGYATRELITMSKSLHPGEPVRSSEDRTP